MLWAAKPIVCGAKPPGCWACDVAPCWNGGWAAVKAAAVQGAAAAGEIRLDVSSCPKGCAPCIDLVSSSCPSWCKILSAASFGRGVAGCTVIGALHPGAVQPGGAAILVGTPSNPCRIAVWQGTPRPWAESAAREAIPARGGAACSASTACACTGGRPSFMYPIATAPLASPCSPSCFPSADNDLSLSFSLRRLAKCWACRVLPGTLADVEVG